MTKKLFIVDTLVTFRHRYVIEGEELVHAYDEVVMKESGLPNDEFEEVSQKFLGETIIDGREISRKEFEDILANLVNNKIELSSYWLGDKLIRKIDYDQ